MSAWLLTCVLFAPAPVPMPLNVPDAPGPDGVYARCGWQPAAAMRVGAKQYVFRDGKALAEAMQMRNSNAPDAATAHLAKHLNVKALDWKKHMVVTVAAGLRGGDADRIAVTRLVQKDKALTIYYTIYVEKPAPPSSDRPLSPPQATGIGCPAETVLVNRFEGPIKFEREDVKPAKKE